MTHNDFHAPEGVRTRGAVIVVPGRGETRTTYNRFGARLAADAYQVRVIDPPRVEGTSSLLGLAEELTAAVDGLARPLVLVGSDAGAAAIAALVADADTTATWWPEAIVLAGLPGRARSVTGDWDAELNARTSCPVHRGVLTDDESVHRGALGQPLPEELLTRANIPTQDLPRLVLVGDADPLADREALAASVEASTPARLSVVHDAAHDVLNERQHRAVAAEIITFLETLANRLTPIITVPSTDW